MLPHLSTWVGAAQGRTFDDQEVTSLDVGDNPGNATTAAVRAAS